MSISDYYREMTPHEAEAFDKFSSTAWQDEALPWKQYFRVVSCELEVWRRGDNVVPYGVALDCLKALRLDNPTVLDIGASSAYYSEVLNSRGYRCRYTGLDYSPAFQRIAKALYPHVPFDVGDARALPYDDGSFDVVIHGSVILHVRDYAKAIAEAARVSSKYVIFHRTPVHTNPTAYYYKEGYDQPMMEIRFSPSDLFRQFQKAGLRLVNDVELFATAEGYGHRTYVCSK